MRYVRTVLAVHHGVKPGSCSTSYSALTLEAAICLCVDSFPDGDDSFYMPFVTSMALFTNFLEQTGRWTGTDEQLQELRVFYRRAHIAFAALGPLRSFEWSEPTTTERLEFLKGLPLVLRASRLLTSLDAQLRGDPPVPWRQAVLAAAQAAARTSAGELAAFEVFTILRGLGLNTFSGTAERLAEVRETLSKGHGSDRLILLETLAYACFESAFSIGSGDRDQETAGVGHALGRILAHAASTTGSVPRLVLTNPGVLVPARQAEAAVELYAAVGRHLGYLHELGLVVLGKDIAVPPALRRVVLDAWEDVETESRAS